MGIPPIIGLPVPAQRLIELEAIPAEDYLFAARAETFKY